MSDAFLNSVNPSFTHKKEWRVTGVVTKTRSHKATENQTQQRHEHSSGSHTSNTVIKILLYGGSDDDLMFHVKGKPMLYPTG